MFTQTLVLLGFSLALTATALPMPKAENGKNWVVIVAGSNGWYNYRHQVRLEESRQETGSILILI